MIASIFSAIRESIRHHCSGKKRLDLAEDQPPDLVIDITSPSLDRFPIFAQVGLPEVWRYDGGRVQIFARLDGRYLEAEHSAALSVLDADLLTRFLRESSELTSTTWLRRVRQWYRST